MKFVNKSFENMDVKNGDFIETPPNSNVSSCLSSKNVTIKVGEKTVGAIQNFAFDEGSNSITGSCSRIYFDKQNILEAFTGQSTVEHDPINVSVDYGYGPILTFHDFNIVRRSCCFSVKNENVVFEHITWTASRTTITEKETKAPKGILQNLLKEHRFSDAQDMFGAIRDYCVDHPGALFPCDEPKKLLLGFIHEDETVWNIRLADFKESTYHMTEPVGESLFENIGMEPGDILISDVKRETKGQLFQKALSSSDGRIALCCAIQDSAAEKRREKETEERQEFIHCVDIEKMMDAIVEYCVDHPGDLTSSDLPKLLQIGFAHEDGTHWTIKISDLRGSLNALRFDLVDPGTHPFTSANKADFISRCIANEAGKKGLCDAMKQRADKLRQERDI